MRPCVGIGQLQPMREAFFQAELKAVVTGSGIGELVCDASENSAAIGCVLGVIDVVHSSVEIVGDRCCRCEKPRVDVAAIFKFSALAAYIGGVREPVSRYLILHLEIV